MYDKNSENRAPWPLYSQSFYYSFALDNDVFITYHFLSIFVKVLNKILYVVKTSLSRANE